MKRILLPILIIVLVFCSSTHWAQSKMESQLINEFSQLKRATVISFLKSTGEHNTLLKTLEIADLTQKLSGEGSFTIIAPTDAAFEKLSNSMMNSLLLPENIEQLKAILTYHVIPGNVNTSSMSKTISDNNDEANFTTLNGEIIVAFIKEGIITIEDVKGNEALIEISDKRQSNGYVHIVDTVILPN